MRDSGHEPEPSALVFVDPVSAHPYACSSLWAGPIGGVAASLLRVALTLAAERPVRVLQPGRRRAEREAGVSFEPLDLEALARDREVGAVVVVNAWKVARLLRRRGLAAPSAVWTHGYPGRRNAGLGAALTECGARLLAVSRTQADAIAAFLRGRGAPVPPMEVLYNPIADGLAPDQTARDPNLLLFASSPHKGLDQTLASFAALRRRMPELKLAIADPGYLAIGADPYLPGVIWLGSLPQPRLHAVMRRALCLFHPQTQVADSFGLVVAEANALGTPALVHRGLGANAEMVSGPEQLVDGDDPAAIEARLREWRARPPAVAANPRFRLAAVAREWRRVLADMERPFDAAEAALRARPAFAGVGPAQFEAPIRSGA